MVSKRILEAIEFAALAHKDQSRKITGIPYVAHPFAVCLILLDAGYSEDVAIAGLLHDVVEDTSYSSEDIESRFGKRVVEMVLGVTEDNNISSKDERLKKYLDVVENSEIEVKAICAADMLHNRICILRELENQLPVWDKFGVTKEEYLKKSQEKLALLKRTLNDSLVIQIEQVLKKIEKF